MTVALFLVTHEGIASEMLKTAEAILQQPADNIDYLEIPMDAETGNCTQQAIDKAMQLNRDCGIVIVTDIFGATPSNIAQAVAKHFHATLISGLNLPMLLRLLNYRHESRQILIDKALEGGRNSIQHH